MTQNGQTVSRLEADLRNPTLQKTDEETDRKERKTNGEKRTNMKER